MLARFPVDAPLIGAVALAVEAARPAARAGQHAHLDGRPGHEHRPDSVTHTDHRALERHQT